MVRAAVRTGNESSMSTVVHNAVQTKMGIRMSVMPGARILRMVTRKLILVISEPTPAICRAQSQ